jgi:hypothetical protein
VGTVTGQEAWSTFVGSALGLALGTATTLATGACGAVAEGAAVIAKHDALMGSGIVCVVIRKEDWGGVLGPARGLTVGVDASLATEAGGVEVGGASVIAKHDALIGSIIVGVVTGQEAWGRVVGPARGLIVGADTALATEAGGAAAGGAAVIAKPDALIGSGIVGAVMGQEAWGWVFGPALGFTVGIDASFGIVVGDSTVGRENVGPARVGAM